jgi:NitT/TauT family transport system substrate-binding protein
MWTCGFTIAVLVIVLFRNNESDLQDATLYLLWEPQAQFIGYYVADDRGFFRDEGLDVHIRHDLGVGESLQQILVSDNSFAINQFINVLGWMERSPDISIASIINYGCNLGWISRGNQETLRTNLAHNQLYSWWGTHDILLKNWIMESNEEYTALPGRVRTDYPPTLEAESAILVMSYNEVANYESRLKDNTAVLKTYCDLGYPIFEDTLAGRIPKSSTEESVRLRMAAAIWKGWEWVRQNPSGALDILMRRGPRKSREHQQHQLAVFLEHLAPADPFDTQPTTATIRTLIKNGLVSESSAMSDLLTQLEHTTQIRAIGLGDQQ